MVNGSWCCRLRRLVRLPSEPVAAATAAVAAPPPAAANYWPRSLERARESPSCRTRLRQALANQRAAQRAPVLGRDQDVGRGGGGGEGRRGQAETYTPAQPSRVPCPAEPLRESGEA